VSTISTGPLSGDLRAWTVALSRCCDVQCLQSDVASQEPGALAQLRFHELPKHCSAHSWPDKSKHSNHQSYSGCRSFSSLGSLYYLRHIRSGAVPTRSRVSGSVMKSTGPPNAPSPCTNICDSHNIKMLSSENFEELLSQQAIGSTFATPLEAQCSAAHPGKNSTFRGGFDDSSADRSDTSQMHPPQFEVWHRDTLRAWGARISDLTVDLVRGSVVSQVGDGHCLFYCLLGRSDVEAAMALRSSIATHIMENFDQLLAGSTQSYNDILELEFFSGFVGDCAQKYYDIMANCTDFLEDNTAHWGGYLEIYAYCEIFSSRADVYELACTDASGIDYFRHVYSVGNLSSPRVIHLAFYGDHWNNVEFETPAPHMDLVPYIPAPVLDHPSSSGSNFATVAEFSNTTATSSATTSYSDTCGPAIASSLSDTDATSSAATPVTVLIKRKQEASTGGANELMAMGATLNACYTCFVAEEGANQMWRRWTGSEAQRLKSWENYQLAKSCYKDNFILCYERKYPEFWAWVKSPIVDGRSTEGKITKNCHPDSALIQRQRAQAVDHYNNVIKRNMTRLDRHMIHHFPEDAEEWKKAKDAEKKRKANNTKKDRAALAVPEAAYDALQPLALVQGESQPDGLIGAELNEPTGNFCFSILCLCLPRFLSLSCFFFKIVFTSAFTFTLSMPFYFGPGENPTVSTKASEEKSISSLFSSSRRVVQGETLADLSDQSFNSSIESGDSYLGDTIVEYPATLSLDAELDAELLNATDAKSDNTRKGRSACQKTSFPAPLLEADPPDLFFQSEERKDGRQQLSEDGRVTIEPSTPAVPLKPVLPSPRAILLEADPPDLLLQSKERKDGRQQLSEDGRATIEPSTPAVPLKPVLPSPRAILLEADTPDLLRQSKERKDGRQQLSEVGRATIEPSTPAVPLKPVLPSPRAILLEADPPDLLRQSKERKDGRQRLSEDGRATIEPSTPAVPLKPVLPSPRAILLEADPPDLLLQSKERKDGRQQLSEDGRATIEPSTPAVPLKPVLPSPRAILLEADTPDLLLQSGERKDGRQQLSEDGRATIEPSTPAVPLKPVLPSPRAILLEADPPDLLLQSKEMTGGLSPLLPLTLSMERSPDDEAHEETHEDGKSVLRELPSGALPKEPVSGAGHDEKHAAMMKMLKALKNGQETKFDELFVKLGFDPRTILPTSGALDRVLALSKAAFVILGIYPNQVSDILKRSDGPTSAALEHVPEAILKLIQDRSAAGRGFGPAGIYGELVPSSVKELMILGKRGALTVFLCLNSCALMTPVRPTLIFLHRLCVCASIHFFRSLVS